MQGFWIASLLLAALLQMTGSTKDVTSKKKGAVSSRTGNFSI
jgi:hypothetical protein